MKKFLRYVTLSLLLAFTPYDLLKAIDCPHCGDLRDTCFAARARPNGVGGASGKWIDNETPKRGWTRAGEKDLGAGITEQCGMCEREQVRYIHYMRHGDLQLRVGRVCAGYMAGNSDDEKSIRTALKESKRIDAQLRNRFVRRANFPDLLGWKISQYRNPIITIHGNKIIIRKSEDRRYYPRINNQNINKFSRTVKRAKLNAFDYLWPAEI